MMAGAVGLVGCDHATKLAAVEHLADRRPIPVAEGLLSLTYTKNYDVGFHLLRWIPQDARFWVIAALGLLLLIGVSFAWYRARHTITTTAAAGFALVLGGGIGNLVDRIARGYVVDFVHLHHWPVFNMADVFLVVGAGLLVLSARGITSPTQGSPAPGS